MIKKILLIFILLFPFSAFSYELNDNDFILIDKVENKIYNLIDEKPWYSPEKIVLLLENYTNNIKNNKLIAILEVVIDDIKYEYYLGEYKEEDYINENDCFEWEIYDEEEWYCYIQEFTDDYDYGEYINDNLEYHDLEHYDNDLNNEWIEKKSDETVKNSIVSYEIKWNEIELLSWKSSSKDSEVWNLFITIIPKEYRKDFKLFNVSNDSSSDTFAHVSQNESDNNKWDLSVNLALFYKDWVLDKKESIHTLIHEFAHVLTLNKTQVKYVPVYLESDSMFDRLKNNCNTNFISEWCLKEEWFLNKFINTFWIKNFSLSQSWEDNDFYTWYENDFVTDYASTNPWEDISETFTFFVLKNKPSSDNISDKKILFMYKDEKLLILRWLIRNRLGLIK